MTSEIANLACDNGVFNSKGWIHKELFIGSTSFFCSKSLEAEVLFCWVLMYEDIINNISCCMSFKSD